MSMQEAIVHLRDLVTTSRGYTSPAYTIAGTYYPSELYISHCFRGRLSVVYSCYTVSSAHGHGALLSETNHRYPRS
jgi:hypothetical protein